MNTIASLVSQLQPDPWRKAVGFSPDLEAVAELFRSEDPVIIADAANDWIHRNQPCLFGRAAAKTHRIHYCVLTNGDLKQSDSHIQDRIQAERTAWTKTGFRGAKSGFVIIAASDAIAGAAPSALVRDIACRLTQLYLIEREEGIEPDRIYVDRLWLEKAGDPVAVWEWLVGVNYFSSQGDRRWWHDHRFPGGMALSMNSVGHMMKSAALSMSMAAMHSALGLPAEQSAGKALNSLGDALGFAMRTIANASPAVSGPATALVPAGEPDVQEVPSCPIELRGDLAGKSHCEYFGWYHTDITLPSEYFDPAVERPQSLQGHALDFTYLFHDVPENRAFITMGKGRRVRDDGDVVGADSRGLKSAPTVRPIESCARLLMALRDGPWTTTPPATGGGPVV